MSRILIKIIEGKKKFAGTRKTEIIMEEKDFGNVTCD